MSKYISLKVGVIDGALFFFVVIALYVFSDASSSPALQLQKVFTLFWRQVIYILLPLSVFVGWRGKSDVQRILSGNPSFVRPILEGFLGPFIALVVLYVGAALNVAFASGEIYDGAKAWGFGDWVYFTYVVLGMSAFVGGGGALLAFVLHMLNRFLIVVLRGAAAV